MVLKVKIYHLIYQTARKKKRNKYELSKNIFSIEGKGFMKIIELYSFTDKPQQLYILRVKLVIFLSVKFGFQNHDKGDLGFILQRHSKAQLNS